VTVAARAIKDADDATRGPQVRLNRADWISRRVGALRTNELRGGKEHDEDDATLLQSSTHDPSLRSPQSIEPRRT
jgi:hypothetical protein